MLQALSSLRMSKPSMIRSDTPLSDDQILQFAPSVLAQEKHESRGDRYAFIPTLSVLEGLRGEGFQPFEVRQTRVRDQSRKEHTKHMIRLRHPDAVKTADGVGEIVLLNSHDGTSSFQLMSGFFRMVCSNGLMAGNLHDDIRIRHSGNVIDDVIEGSFRVIDSMNMLEESIESLRSIELNDAAQLVFAKAALQLKYEDNAAPIEPVQILQPRRFEDRKPDLWTVMNRVQENMLKGGVRGVSSTGRNMRTREVGGVNENVRLNKAIWTLATEMERLITGKE